MPALRYDRTPIMAAIDDRALALATNEEFFFATEPLEPRVTGDRYFFVDDKGVIRFSADGPAGPLSMPIGG